MTPDRQDVIIVGAPRSGTNMLRDVLTSFDGVDTWPCDEINLIWRHGNRDLPSDELTPEMADDRVKHYLRGQFEKLRRKRESSVVVEKTCATSLRVGFVREVLPRARFVVITRDGIDAAASAMDRWHAPLDLAYTMRKVRFVPPTDVPHYARRFVKTQVSRRSARSRIDDRQVRTWWGPRPHDYRQVMASRPLDEVCAIQWQRCVERTLDDLHGLPAHQVHHVSYERFVADPRGQAERLIRFLGLDGDPGPAVAGVSSRSVGKGRASLGEEAVSRLETVVGPTLSRLGRG